MRTSIFTKFGQRFSSSYAHHSSVSKPKTTSPIPMSTPATSSFAADFKAVEQSVEALFTYTVSTAVSHLKTEIDNLENFVTAKSKLVTKNAETITSLTNENVTHTNDITKAADTIAKLKAIVTA